MKKILFILVLMPVLVLAQTTTENYTKATTYRGAGATKPSIQVTYFDGLGRPVQQIANAQSNTGKDIVTHIEYDAFGRQTKEYLPYPSLQSNMNYIVDITAKQDTENHYQQAYGDSNPYSEKLLENSPLNRVLKQAAPGNDWVMGLGHEVKMEYLTNAASEVKRFKATSSWNGGYQLYDIGIAQQGTYVANELYKTITNDEGNKNTEEFKNKNGQVILKRTFNSGAHDTYYVYDQYGNLTYVIPPLAEGAIDQPTLDGLCYQYQYDTRNRLAAKKLPGKQWEYIVYDKQDRPVATGPAFSPWGEENTHGILITEYDAFGRVTQTGWKPMEMSESNRATYQNDIETDSYLVVLELKEVLTKNYYDTYTFLNGLVPLPTAVEGQTVATSVKGQATGSWVRVLTVPGELLGETSYTLYDTKYRPIRTETKNYLGGYTLVDTQLDFMGKTEYTLTRQSRDGGGEIVIKDSFEYTAQDRLALHKQQIGNLPEQLIASNTYDALGQLISKNVGGEYAAAILQKVDYTYNIRGWLKGINDINNLNDIVPKDLFAFKLSYNDPTTATPLYNGNISQTFWKTKNDDVLRQYDYKYDDLNRLLMARYVKSGNLSNMDSYGESLSYDKNGNIKTLQRYGEYDDSNYAMLIDELTYVYDNNNKNQLNTVFDSTNDPKGFKDDTDGYNIALDSVDYKYDANGNMTDDENKNMGKIPYNHLNLPIEIDFGGTNTGKINYIYNAAGQKMQKKVTDTNGEVVTDYLSGFQYKNTLLEFFPHAEGYVNVTDGSIEKLNYVFNYTDHLGNVRVTYGIDPSSNELKIMEENNYYPFGLKHNNYNMDKKNYEEMMSGIIKLVPVTSMPYNYKYNGKELQDELGLNMYDYGNRLYDPARAGWSNMDPLAENSRRWSPYNYCYNNPIHFVDPDGMQADDVIFRGKDNKEIRVVTPGADKVVNLPFNVGSNRTIDIGVGNIDSGRFVFGYTAQADLNGGIGVAGQWGGEVSVANFSDSTYGGYNYVYAGGHINKTIGAQIGLSGSVGGSLFVGYNDSSDPINPSSFEGKTYSANVSADLKDVVGGGVSVSGFSSVENPIKDKGWKGVSIGVNVGVGVSANAGAIGHQVSNTALLNNVTPTSQRSFTDKTTNSIAPVTSAVIQATANQIKKLTN